MYVCVTGAVLNYTEQLIIKIVHIINMSSNTAVRTEEANPSAAERCTAADSTIASESWHGNHLVVMAIL